MTRIKLTTEERKSFKEYMEERLGIKYRREMIEKMTTFMVYVNEHQGYDYGYGQIYVEETFPEMFDKKTHMPLAEYEDFIFSELDWTPYIREEAEDMFDEGFRLVSLKDGEFNPFGTFYTLKQIA